MIAAFRVAMDDDLDTPKATALIFDTVRRANVALDAGDAAAAVLTAAVHGDLRRRRSANSARPADVPADVADLAAALDVARAERDFARADAIRADLQAAGWTVETTKAGTTIRR